MQYNLIPIAICVQIAFVASFVNWYLSHQNWTPQKTSFDNRLFPNTPKGVWFLTYILEKTNQLTIVRNIPHVPHHPLHQTRSSPTLHCPPRYCFLTVWFRDFLSRVAVAFEVYWLGHRTSCYTPAWMPKNIHLPVLTQNKLELLYDQHMDMIVVYTLFEDSFAR
jgi:hypothetical protein